MFIREMSDLHIEFGHSLEGCVPHMPEDDQTVLVLAGDIGVGTMACAPIAHIAKRFKHVIYIMGNHEYYHEDITAVYNECKSFLADVRNVSVLENEDVEIDGVQFIGATLWTDFDKTNAITMSQARYMMSDYHVITDGWRRLTPETILEKHKVSRGYISSMLKRAQSDSKPAVVVTHHGPSFQCVSEHFRKDKLNGAYFSDLDALILDRGPFLWFFGHSHWTTQTQIGQTLVRNNPFGYYRREENPEFDPKLRFTVNMEDDDNGRV